MENQKEYLKLCIKAVLKLYKNQAKQVILVGHSMGGVIANSMLTDNELAALINSIIYIATPLDYPVVNLDHNIQSFYENTSAVLSRKRDAYKPNNETNCCLDPYAANKNNEEFQTNLHNILLLSIGGGNRDLLVRDGLTTSIYSDVHAMVSLYYFYNFIY